MRFVKSYANFFLFTPAVRQQFYGPLLKPKLMSENEEVTTHCYIQEGVQSLPLYLSRCAVISIGYHFRLLVGTDQTAILNKHHLHRPYRQDELLRTVVSRDGSSQFMYFVSVRGEFTKVIKSSLSGIIWFHEQYDRQRRVSEVLGVYPKR